MNYLITAFIGLIALSVQAERLTSPDHFPSSLPGLCVQPMSCSEEVILKVKDYQEGTSKHHFQTRTLYTGKCEFIGSQSFVTGAHNLVLIQEHEGRYYAGIRFSGPLRDYTGKETRPTWDGKPFESILNSVAKSVGNEIWELNLKPNFAFVDSRRTDNTANFVSWLRWSANGQILYHIGYFSQSIFVCELHNELVL